LAAENFFMQNAIVKNADAFIIVFDITNRESFNIVKGIYLDNYNAAGKLRACNQVTLIVGAKTDLSDNRVITYEEGRELATQLNATYLEVSSAINTNVTTIFDRIIEELIPQDDVSFEDEEDEEMAEE
jgi:GTPase SAR1 family protein